MDREELRRRFEAGDYGGIIQSLGERKAESFYLYLSRVFTNERVSNDEIAALKGVRPPQEGEGSFGDYHLAMAISSAYSDPESSLLHLVLFIKSGTSQNQSKEVTLDEKLRVVSNYLGEVDDGGAAERIDGPTERKKAAVVLYLGGVLSLLLDTKANNKAFEWLTRYWNHHKQDVLFYDALAYLSIAANLMPCEVTERALRAGFEYARSETSRSAGDLVDHIDALSERLKEYERAANGNSTAPITEDTINELKEYLKFSITLGTQPLSADLNKICGSKLRKLMERDLAFGLLEASVWSGSRQRRRKVRRFYRDFYKRGLEKVENAKFDPGERPKNYSLYKGLASYNKDGRAQAKGLESIVDYLIAIIGIIFYRFLCYIIDYFADPSKKGQKRGMCAIVDHIIEIPGAGKSGMLCTVVDYTTSLLAIRLGKHFAAVIDHFITPTGANQKGGLDDIVNYLIGYLKNDCDRETCRLIMEFGRDYCSEGRTDSTGHHPALRSGDLGKRECRMINEAIDRVKRSGEYETFKSSCEERELEPEHFLRGFTVLISAFYNEVICRRTTRVERIRRRLARRYGVEISNSSIFHILSKVFEVRHFSKEMISGYLEEVRRQEQGEDENLKIFLGDLKFWNSKSASLENIEEYLRIVGEENANPEYMCHAGYLVPKGELNDYWKGRLDNDLAVRYLNTEIGDRNSKFLFARDTFARYREHLLRRGEDPAELDAVHLLALMNATIGIVAQENGDDLPCFNATDLLWRGIHHYEQEKFDDSEAELDRYKEFIDEMGLDPYSFHFYYFYGSVKLNLGKYEEAIENFEKYRDKIRGSEESPPPIIELCRNLFPEAEGRSRLFEGYIKFLQERECREIFPDVDLKLIDAYFRHGMYENVPNLVERIYDENKDGVTSKMLYMAVKSYFETGKYKDAIEFGRKHPSTDEKILEILAMCHAPKKEYTEFVEILQKLESFDYTGLIRHLFGRKNWDAAYPFYTTYVINALAGEFGAGKIEFLKRNLQFEPSLFDFLPETLPDAPCEMLVPPYFLLPPSSEYILYSSNEESAAREFLKKYQEGENKCKSLNIKDLVEFYRAVVRFETGSVGSTKAIDFPVRKDFSQYLLSKFDRGLRTKEGIKIGILFKFLKSSGDDEKKVELAKEILRLVKNSNLPVDVKQQLRLVLLLVVENGDAPER